MIRSKIVATGSGIPEKVVTNFDLEKLVDTSDEWISQRTGIKERRVVIDETAADLATTASNEIIEKSGIDPLDIDMIIVSTCSPDYLTPNVACVVQNNIGAKNAACVDVSAACAGFTFALSVADKYVISGAKKCVLVLASEIISKFTNWEDRSTCVLFGDAAGGVLLVPEENDEGGLICEEIGSKGEGWEVLGNGGLPISNAFNGHEKIKPEDTYVFMDGREVFKFATGKLRESIDNVLQLAKMDKEEVTWVVPHQANIRIIEVVAKKVGIPMDKFYLNIERFGNTSSASIPVALNEMAEKGLLKKGDNVVLSGFGGGLCWGTILVKWC